MFMHQFATADGWFCQEESGKREGDTILSCGVAEWNDEGIARKKALDAAIDEFQSICEISEDCKRRKIIVEPKRTSCAKDSRGIIKCYRMIAIKLLD